MNPNSVDKDKLGRLRDLLESVATLLMVVVAAGLVYRLLVTPAAGRERAEVQPELPAELLSLEGATLRGNPKARVALIEYSDFQCPYCGVFARETFPSLDAEYVSTGKVLIAFRHFPLRSMHPLAAKAAEIALCAGAQGRFWEMHDRLFAEKQLDEASLRGVATGLGVDNTAFGDCLAGQKSATVSADEASGKKLGVTGTPTFFVGVIENNGRVRVTDRIAGAASEAQFKASLKKALALN